MQDTRGGARKFWFGALRRDGAGVNCGAETDWLGRFFVDLFPVNIIVREVVLLADHGKIICDNRKSSQSQQQDRGS